MQLIYSKHSLFLPQEHTFSHPPNQNRCQTETVFLKQIEGHQLCLNFSMTRIRLSCAPWKISADIYNIKAKGASDGLSPYCQTCVWHDEGDGMTLGLIWDCHFLCFFSCSPWWFGTFQQSLLAFPHSCAGQAVWAYGITMLLTNLPLLNRKNGPAGGVCNPCRFTAGGRRAS